MGAPFRTPKRRLFLEALAEGYSVRGACRAAEVGRRTVYEWREADAEFAAAWQMAIGEGTECLEDEARRRAVEGVTIETPIWRDGKLIDTLVETKYSDTLLIFLLKARDPKYRDNSTPTLIQDNRTVNVISGLTDEQIRQALGAALPA